MRSVDCLFICGQIINFILYTIIKGLASVNIGA